MSKEKEEAIHISEAVENGDEAADDEQYSDWEGFSSDTAAAAVGAKEAAVEVVELTSTTLTSDRGKGGDRASKAEARAFMVLTSHYLSHTTQPLIRRHLQEGENLI